MATSTGFTDATDHWNRRFEVEAYIFGTEPNVWLREHAGIWCPGQRVLSIADGEGRNSVWLAQQGLVVDAFDISPVAVEKARKLAAARGVNVNVAVSDVDGYAWPEGVYDGIAAVFFQFANPAMRARLFDRIKRAMKPGGFLVLQGYTPKQIEYKTGGPPHVENMYTQALLREAFGDMEIVELREYEAEVNEGTGHHGYSALIGMVAKKK